MGIVSSAVASVNPQIDGRRWIREIHTDQLGMQYVQHWIANNLEDIAAALAAHAAVIDARLTTNEIAENIDRVVTNGSLAVLVFNFSTAGESRSALREAYKSATRMEAIMIGDFLSSQTNATLQTLFSMTNNQVNTLRTNKLTPAATNATAIRAAAGQ